MATHDGPDGSARVEIASQEGLLLLLLAQRTAFIKRFGREHGPHDPVFFDPTSDEPTYWTVSAIREALHLIDAQGHGGAPRVLYE